MWPLTYDGHFMWAVLYFAALICTYSSYFYTISTLFYISTRSFYTNWPIFYNSSYTSTKPIQDKITHRLISTKRTTLIRLSFAYLERLLSQGTFLLPLGRPSMSGSLRQFHSFSPRVHRKLRASLLASLVS